MSAIRYVEKAWVPRVINIFRVSREIHLLDRVDAQEEIRCNINVLFVKQEEKCSDVLTEYRMLGVTNTLDIFFFFFCRMYFFHVDLFVYMFREKEKYFFPFLLVDLFVNLFVLKRENGERLFRFLLIG